MLLSRLGDDMFEMFENFIILPYIFIGIISLATIAIIITVIVKIVKKQKQNVAELESENGDSENTIANIFKKTFENAQAKLDSENAKYKKVTCPYCGAVNKGTDTKCSGCSAPLNSK